LRTFSFKRCARLRAKALVENVWDLENTIGSPSLRRTSAPQLSLRREMDAMVALLFSV
jgi:hypothetical protein